MSEADIDPEDELLIEGGARPVDEDEWDDVGEEERTEHQPGRLEEREQRQHAEQQHGETFAGEGGKG